MDFDYLRQLFESAVSIRNKYPAVKRQIRFLQTLYDERDKVNVQATMNEEVSKLKTFLISNSAYQERTFAEPIFKGKKGPIDMGQVLNLLAEEHKIKFIDALTDAEMNLFPRGKPKLEVAERKPGGATGNLFNSVQNEELKEFMSKANLDKNGFLSSIVGKLAASDSFNNFKDPSNLNMTEIMNDPALLNLADDISDNLSKGEFSKADVENSINCISEMINESDEPSPAKDIVGSLKTIMKDINSGRQPNISSLVKQFTELQAGGALPGDLPDMSIVTEDLLKKISSKKRR
jgi:hypothetical protein